MKLKSHPRSLVTIVMPVFNEEQGIPQLKAKLLEVERLLSAQYDLEFLFVDDGSLDGTVASLQQHFTNGATPFRVMQHGANRGVGAAFRTGFEQARGEFVCTIDADCTYSPEGLANLLEALHSTGADISVASPYHPLGSVEGVSGWRLALSKGCSRLYRIVLPVKLYTYTSIFRAYRAEVLRNVQFKSSGFVAAAEILVNAARKRYTVTEVPMTLRSRSIGRSKMKVLSTLTAHLKLLFGSLALVFEPGSRALQHNNISGLLRKGMAQRDSKDPFAA